ncbi:alpha/beta fold hydrolase [Corynebacterium mustelae]|uniref:alpha/beta fold hydrolase n=1 Tax=Corynebacterium mustelae TaxID=571915 RepID=UPI0006412B1B|nr:alpha/beta hydrolase [Corynebacterium mustelae]
MPVLLHRKAPTVKNLSPNVVALEGEFHHHNVHTRGIRLHAATAGDPSNPAIVLLHDAVSCWTDFKDVLPLLGKMGFHAIAIDFRGFGMSDKPPTGYDLRHFTGDIAGAIRTLGHESAHLVGMGTGATIAWTMATSHPNHVASITTCGAIHPTDMRRIVLRKPWLFSNLITNSLLFRLPTSVIRRLCASHSRFIRRDLRNNTGLEFQQTPQFTQSIRLRETALAITNTRNAMIRSFRLMLRQPPMKWLGEKIHVPVHMLVDDSLQSAALITAARHRCLLGIRLTQIPKTRLQPHLENPQAFTSFVGTFVKEIEQH